MRADHETKAQIADMLRHASLCGADERPMFNRLTGGVSSDIWRVDLARGPVCVKRALPKLRVTAEWRAPVERNAYEVAWFQTVAGIVPDAVPSILAHQPAAGLFAMTFLDSAQHPLWKHQLRDGVAERSTAAAVAQRLVRIHAATADDPGIAGRFATDDNFHAIRLEPYLLASAAAHPDCAGALEVLAARTAATRRALVHGDVSPKNIVTGPRGPMFLDAECAWYGDPAFDLAFCLNHFLLKCLWTPAATRGFMDCFDTMTQTYLDEVSWEPAHALEQRAAALLPGLFLARVDGKSPVEYLTEETDKERVRGVARKLLLHPVETLVAVRTAWGQELGL